MKKFIAETIKVVIAAFVLVGYDVASIFVLKYFHKPSPLYNVALIIGWLFLTLVVMIIAGAIIEWYKVHIKHEDRSIYE